MHAGWQNYNMNIRELGTDVLSQQQNLEITMYNHKDVKLIWQFNPFTPKLKNVW